jgi:protease-4
MAPESVQAVAQGRVWLGDDAVAHGLVDEIGGLEAALAEARTRAGVAPGEKIRLLELRRPRGTLLERMVRNWVAEALAGETSMRSFEGPQFRDLEWLEAAGE